MQISVKNKEKVIEAIREGAIDAADVSFPNLIDAIILKMKQVGILELLEKAFSDKRSANMNIPFHVILTLAITAKMKLKTSLTDIPFAITDGETLSEIGWNIWDNERSLEEGLMSEGTIRNLVKKYTAEELIQAYNVYVQEQVYPNMDIKSDIHILDCTEIKVEVDNDNYEYSEVIKDEEGIRRGYKLSTLRGIVGDTGILEEVKLGSIKQHDLELSREMILKSNGADRLFILPAIQRHGRRKEIYREIPACSNQKICGRWIKIDNHLFRTILCYLQLLRVYSVVCIMWHRSEAVHGSDLG